MSAGMRDSSVVDAHFGAAGDAATEGNPAAAAAAALQCLCDLSSATHGQLVWRGSTQHEVAFGDGQRPRDNVREIRLGIGGHTFGDVSLWGCDSEFVVDDARADAARLALSIRAAELGHVVGEQTSWRRAVAHAVAELGSPVDSARLARRAVEAATKMVSADAGFLVDTQGTEPVMWHHGLGALDGAEPLDLMPLEARTLRSGSSWSGDLDSGPLAAEGLESACAVGLGPRAGSRVLLLLSSTAGAFGEAQTDALTDFSVSLAALFNAVEKGSSAPGLVDGATGLPDLRYYIERLAQETTRAERHLRSVSVLTVALDATSGDRIDDDLLSLAEMAVREVRTGDVPCRIGAETLGIIMADVETMDAVLVADRLRARVRESSEFSAQTTLSVGAATFPARAGSAKELRQAATRALGWARDGGGDRTFVYEREIAATLSDEVQSEGERDDAIAQSLRLLADAVDGRRGAHGHAARVADLSRMIAREMGFSSERAERLHIAAMLHDIGQISLSAEALSTSEPLDSGTTEELREHPDIGARLLAGTPFNDLRPWIRHHHERNDGQGYPDHLAGDQIPVESQIIGVAETFDELTANRPYRDAVSTQVAMEEIQRCSGSQFNPAVVDALGALAERGALDAAADRNEGSE